METRGSTDKQTSEVKNGPPEDSQPVVDPVGVEELSQEHFSSLRLLFFLVMSVFLAEVVAMIVVYELPPLPYEYVTLIDAGIMTILIFPMLYFLAFQPLVRHISRRRQAEKAVEAQRKRFDNILEALPAYVVLLTPDYQVPFANRVFRERFGESEGKRCYEHLFGRSEPCEICETYRVLDIMSPTRWEWTGPDRRIYDVFDYPFTDADGSTMILEMGIDITEQKRAEEQVREMALFPALNPGAVLRANAGGQIDKSNPSAEAMGFCVGAQLTDVMPELGNLDLAYCIAAGTTQQVQETLWGERVFQWTIRGVPEQRFAFLYGTDITLRKQAENLNRQLSRIVEQTEDTVVVTNRDGVIEYVNPAFERQTGYTNEEALGKTPRVIRSGLHDAQFYQIMWNTVLKGDVFQGEIANRKKNGEVFYEVKTITPLRDAQGNITHFVATGKDITQHKLAEEKLLKTYDELELRVWERTEELRITNTELEDEIRTRRQIETELRDSEQRLKRAQEIAHLGSWELDLVSNQLTWSDEVYRIFGLQPQEFGATYGAFLEAVHPDDRVAVDAAYSGSIRDGRDQYEIEHRVVRQSNGEVRTVHEKCEHFRNEAGQIIRSIGMVHDITEHKQAEEALRLSEEKFRSAFANTAIGFAMTTPDGRFVDANPAYCALTSYEIEELQTMEFSSLIHPEDRAENMKLIARMLAGQISDFMLENRYLRKDKEPVWVRKSISVVRNAENAPQWLIALVEDITERKQTEEALRRAYDELEVRVEERTKELASANRDLVKEVAERKEVERQLRIQTTAMESAANGIIITDRQGYIQWANPALTQICGYDVYELIGQSMRIFRSGQNSPEYYARMWDTILSGEVWQGETINKRKDGSLYIEEQTITPVRDEAGQVSHFIAIKQDITKRKQDEKELEQRNTELQIISNAERNQRQFSEALVGAALIVGKSLKLNEVLTLILEQVREVIPYQLANISLLEGDSFFDACHHGDLPWPASLMGMNNRFLIDRFPLLSEMRRCGKPILVLDSQKQPDWVGIEGMNSVRSLLSAPLLAEQKVMGFVTLFSDQPEFFTQEMSNRLVAFAAHAVVAIQNAWLFEQVQASTERLQSLSRRLVEIQENERRYISRELHDEAGQVLTSLLVDLRLLEKNISEPKILQKIVTEMESSLNGVIKNLHRIAMALRPASLDHVGLVAALRQHTESMAEKHGLNISFTSSGVVERLPANVETVLYRIVQESLTNIVRHAHATRVDVVLTVRDGKLIVIIEDDGIGFDPDSAPAGTHLGLFGMRERAEMIDAKLMIESSPRNGTTIMMEVAYADTIVGRR